MGPWLKVLSDRLEKPGIRLAIPGLQGEWFIRYTKVAPTLLDTLMGNITNLNSVQSFIFCILHTVVQHLMIHQSEFQLVCF